ncbi:MAG: TrkA family potassium uptake protein [Trueperaceae bacterium]|nr:TrkA family potassium uptake protein [Trueperaceae bacterium]
MKAQQFFVIGAGRFGAGVATTLYEFGHEVVVVDARETAVKAVMDHVTHAVVADATNEETLRKLGIANFDTVVVAIGTNLEANILATVAAKSSGVKRVISKATTEQAARVLERVGADLVVRPEHDMGVRLGQQLASPGIVDAFNLGEVHGVVEVEAGKKLVGRLDELRLPNRFAVTVIAVNRGGEVTISPGADYAVREGDRLVIIGGNAAIAKLRRFLAE